MSFIELVVVMAIFSTLSGLITVNLLSVKHKTSLNTVVTTLASDFRNQQMKVLIGNTEGRMVNDNYGIYFETNRYILFHGSSFNPSESTNFAITLEDNITFINISFPASTLVFSKGSGEITGFMDGSNTITIKNILSNEERIVSLNRYGVVTLIN